MQAWKVISPEDPLFLGRYVQHDKPWVAWDLNIVSINHCEIWWKLIGGKTQWYVRDLDSTNGTFLNKERIELLSKVKLKDGDHRQLGHKFTIGEMLYRCIVKVRLDTKGPKIKSAEKFAKDRRNKQKLLSLPVAFRI